MSFASHDMTAGQLNAIVKKLGGEEGAMRFLRGESEVISNHVVPHNWNINKDIEGHGLQWNPTNEIKLWAADENNDRSTEGNQILSQLADKQLLNAEVLEFLLKNKQFIPEQWKGKAVFFCGTIYSTPGGNHCVRYLFWSDNDWDWGYDWLDNHWGTNTFVAISSK